MPVHVLLAKVRVTGLRPSTGRKLADLVRAPQRRQLTGRGGVDKMAVVGVKDRATRRVRAAVVPDTTGRTLRGFVEGHAGTDATVYTDGEPAYEGVKRQHEAVRHTVGEDNYRNFTSFSTR